MNNTESLSKIIGTDIKLENLNKSKEIKLEYSKEMADLVYKKYKNDFDNYSYTIYYK